MPKKKKTVKRSNKYYLLLPIMLFSALLGIAFTMMTSAATPKQVLVLGDSLVSGSSNYIHFYLTHDGKAQANIKAVGGTAICDILPGNGGPWTLNSLLAAKRYDAVVIAYSGNNMTKCTGYLKGQALVEKYKTDTNAALKISKQYGVPNVVLVKPPAAAAADLNYIRKELGTFFGFLPGYWANVRVIDGGNMITPGGKFSLSLPCQSWEATASHGCVINSIRVGDDDGVHFYCSKRGPSYYGVVPPCDTYSSGSNSYGMNLAGTRKFIGL